MAMKFVKFHGKKDLYPNLCSNEVCYKGTALYLHIGDRQKLR